MQLESIGYMAILLEYIAQGLNCTMREVAEGIGEKGVERLCHNAPMNSLLPINKIADEVIYDYSLPGAAHFNPSWRNVHVGDTYMKAVAEKTTDKSKYVHIFYKQIIGH